jgi:UDP-glucose 4-epimerase
MKALVTGANGFVGRALVRALVADGHEVDALDVVDVGVLADFNIHHFYAQDISVPFSLKDTWDVVFHLAAYNVTHVGDALEGVYRKINIDGTQHVINGVKADRFVFLSTVKVYARHAGVIDEMAELSPAGLYEKSKLAAEDVCRKIVPSDRLIILRSVNIMGPGQPDKAVVPVFFKKALRHEPVEIFGPRRQCLQFLDVDDAAQALCAAAKAFGASGVFNIASSELVRLDELVLSIKDLCASRSDIKWCNDDSEAEVRFSSARAKDVLAWAPRYDLKRSLKRCFEYYAKRP